MVTKRIPKKINLAMQKFSLLGHNIRPTILPLLNEHVFHVTRYSSFKQIMKDGFIFPNGDGRYGSAFSSSKGNYGNFKNYVCLFDFRNKNTEDIEDAILKCNFLEGHFLGNHISFLFIKKELHDSLIHQDVMKAEVGYSKRYIPYVECWATQPIPISMIDQVIHVSIQRKPTKPFWAYLPSNPNLKEKLKAARERLKKYNKEK